MNTHPFSPRKRAPRSGRLAALVACLLIAALLLPGTAGWSAQATPAAQDPPLSRLPYDGLFDLPQLAGAAPLLEAAPALTGPEYTEWSRLVFQSARNNRDWEIYSARGDGSDQVNISNHSSMDIYPRLNRGATRVAFASNRHGNYEIFAINANGSGQTRLTTANGNDMLPAWSPDGSRIAFQAYRNGQAEIYVMNANGSGQTRLTNYGDYDGEPAWSPDGSQIAFVRQASDQYRVWVMNADGSNPRQLSNQANSENPAWSPDGSQIAYDCDGNGDGWQEIWLMNADGSNQRQVYDPPEYTTDAWVGSWSPDGRYVAFTRISWTYYQGQWYWTTAYLYAWDSVDPWRTILLSGNGADWNPRWESTDAQAPTSSVHPLPAQSPGPFAVAWSGSDAGGSEFKNFDVQVKDGASGAWSNWQSATGDTSASYPGVGGHTYFFRSRARDNAGNVEAWPTDHDAVTTAEAIPPQTAVNAPPAYSRNPVLITWGGNDPGGSGILSYDVQYRLGGTGAWMDWLTGVTQTSATFTGTAGTEYRFRARARDRAQNVEAWPARADAITVLYTWAIGGAVTDNRGAPVVGMATTTTPTAFHAPPSDGDGAYRAYAATEAASYSASWSKSGYGSLPSTAFVPNPDAAFSVILPPGDNVVQNWGFEEDMSGTWDLGGDVLPSLAASASHTGQSGASMGWRFTLVATIPGIAEASLWDAKGAIDGSLHILAQSNRLIYARRAPDGAWSENILSSNPNCEAAKLAIAQSGVVYAVWSEPGLSETDVFFRQRTPTGQWSAPANLSNTTSTFSASRWLGLDDNGGIHVIWIEGADPDHPQIVYTYRNMSGSWSSPIQVSNSAINTIDLEAAVVAPSGEVTVVWQEREAGGGHSILSSRRSPAGAWSSPQLLFRESFGDYPHLVIDPNGVLHLLWGVQVDSQTHIRYAYRSPTGVWSSPETIIVANTGGYTRTKVVVDNSGTVHLAFSESYTIKYLRWTMATGWTGVELIAQTPGGSGDAHLGVDTHGIAYVTWRYGQGVYFSRRTTASGWSAPFELPRETGHEISEALVVVDGRSRAHLVWCDFATTTIVRHMLYEAGNSWLRQQLTIPGNVVYPGLSLLYQYSQESPSNGNPFSITIQDSIGASTLFTTTATTIGWIHQWIDLTGWRGSTVTITFQLQNPPETQPALVYLDEVSIGSTHPDIWVSQPAWQAAPPGRTFDTVLLYGNRGGVAASGGQVTLQLPAELSFVSADPPPVATTPVLRWDVGALPAQSEPQSIRVTLQVAASAAGGSTVATTARITSSSAELEQANNTAQGSVYVGSIRYMPVIMR